MSDSVSEHQVRVYEYAKLRLGGWFTIQELSADQNIPDGSAKGHAARLEEMGLFERLRASPAHFFRLSEFAGTRDPKAVRRLEAAIPVFAELRHERVRRELKALAATQRLDHRGARRPITIEVAVGDRTKMVRDQSRADRQIPVLAQDNGIAPSRMIAAASEEQEVPSRSVGAVISPSPDMPDAIGAGRAGRGNKFDLLLAMVSRDEGASLDELVAALGNLAHSIRATISVESRKRGLKIECVKRRYYLRSVA